MKTQKVFQPRNGNRKDVAVNRVRASRPDVESLRDPARLHPLLPVRLCPQETEGWCWAASVEMILNYMGATVTQREIANKHFCTEPFSFELPIEDRGGAWPEFEKFGFTCKVTHAASSWAALTQELRAGRPFAFCRRWDNGAYHLMVVSGCYLTPTGRCYVQIHNPSPLGIGRIHRVPYRQYASGNGFAHERTYYEIRRVQPREHWLERPRIVRVFPGGSAWHTSETCETF